jgi:hypothetical protein
MSDPDEYTPTGTGWQRDPDEEKTKGPPIEIDPFGHSTEIRRGPSDSTDDGPPTEMPPK